MTANERGTLLAVREGELAKLNRQLVAATKQLRDHNNTELRLESAQPRQPLQRSFDEFQAELLRFDGRSPVSESLRQIREVYPIISALAEWQNHRRLNVNREEIETIINRTIRALTIKDYVPQLVALLKWDEGVQKRWNSLLSKLSQPETTNDLKGTAGNA